MNNASLGLTAPSSPFVERKDDHQYANRRQSPSIPDSETDSVIFLRGVRKQANILAFELTGHQQLRQTNLHLSRANSAMVTADKSTVGQSTKSPPADETTTRPSVSSKKQFCLRPQLRSKLHSTYLGEPSHLLAFSSGAQLRNSTHEQLNRALPQFCATQMYLHHRAFKELPIEERARLGKIRRRQRSPNVRK